MLQDRSCYDDEDDDCSDEYDDDDDEGSQFILVRLWNHSRERGSFIIV